MMESPTFDESQLKKSPVHYKKVKPEIDKNKAEKVPGMQELWNGIEQFKQQLDSLKQIKNPSPKQRRQIYLLNHHLIQLRKQQYYLMDSCYPTFLGQKNKGEYHGSIVDEQMNYPVLPRGVMSTKDDRFFCNPRLVKGIKQDFNVVSDEEIEKWKKMGRPFFDFRDRDQVYQLILHYNEILDYVHLIPDSPLHNLLWTLDFYIDKAHLSEQQRLIVEGKKMRLQNREIVEMLRKKLGIGHQENYISTIWNRCVMLIAEAAELNYDEWLCKDFDKAWKTCSCCKKELLRDARNFVRKNKASDGLTGRCKQCDKIVRQGSEKIEIKQTK